MPKITNPKSSSSSSFDDRDLSRPSPYARTQNSYEEDDWKEVQCPICFDHPHNAVLLICSSHETGCRPYMCDTSYRHSNCLDQFCKLHSVTPLKPRTNDQINKFVGYGEKGPDDDDDHQILCPFCRGQIKGWVVEQNARRFMNSLVRECALGSCHFSGKYSELRKHARLEHPSSRPSFLVNDLGHSQEINEADQSFGGIRIVLSLEDPSRDRYNISVWFSDIWGILNVFVVHNVVHCTIRFVRAAEFYIQVRVNGRVVNEASGVV